MRSRNAVANRLVPTEQGVALLTLCTAPHNCTLYVLLDCVLSQSTRQEVESRDSTYCELHLQPSSVTTPIVIPYSSRGAGDRATITRGPSWVPRPSFFCLGVLLIRFDKASKSPRQNAGLWEVPGRGTRLLQLRRLPSPGSGHRIQTLFEHRGRMPR